MTTMGKQSVLMVGAGSYLPARVVSNDELSEFVDTDDGWIKQRTGISQRHIVAEDEKTSDLATHAAQAALANAGLSAADIDIIIVATTTPDDTFPSTASVVQHKLEAYQGFAFDVQAVCAGFVYALGVGRIPDPLWPGAPGIGDRCGKLYQIAELGRSDHLRAIW